MSDVAEEIRCALAMHDAGYAVLFDHETSAELLRRYDTLVKALQDIKQATIDGRVCDDVAWFDTITTLHDFCDQALAAAGRGSE
jgi:hypothetical protein